MQLLRGVHLFVMEYAFYFTAARIAGVEIGPADALSRNQAPLLFSQVLQATQAPDCLPQDLLQFLMVDTPPDWLSETWRR